MIFVILTPLLIVLFGILTKSSIVPLFIIILSKWRMFAVKPRYWLANVRSNMVDIIVGFSIVGFIAGTGVFEKDYSGNYLTMFIWMAVYVLWLTLLKPRSDNLSIGIQAFVAQGLGLVSLFSNHNDWNQVFLISATWLICFSSARHLLATFEDNSNRVLSHVWGVFAAYLAMILGHWQIIYAGKIPQVALILSILGYALGVGYYIHKTKGLRSGLRTQLVFFCVIMLTLIVVLSNWQTSTF